jgi:peptide/nickel transport system permease protein
MTVFVAVTVNFAIFHLAPGDPVSGLSRVPGMTPESQAALRRQFGLDESLLHQYVSYLVQLVHGNLGISFQYQQPVSANLRDAYLRSVPMVFSAAVVAILLGVLVGVVSAWHRGRALDKVSVLTAIGLYSLPSQWLGMVLILIFGAYLPTRGSSDPFLIDPTRGEQLVDYLRHMVLPATTLALVLLGQYAVVVRSALLETLSEDYILTARAKGHSNFSIMRRFAMPNALLPITTLVALSLGFVVAGSVLIETVFSWPGVGYAIYEAVLTRDYPTLQGAFLVLTVSVVCANLIADMLYVKIDPRVAL